MKTIKFFALAAMAIALTLTGCKDPEGPDGPEDPPKSNACYITSFVLNIGDGETITGTVSNQNSTISFSYPDYNETKVKTATAVIMVSENATITAPADPLVARDYTQAVTFTVTAEDGTTTKTYTTVPQMKNGEYITTIKEFVKKSAVDMGIAEKWDDDNGGLDWQGNPTPDHAKYLSIGVSHGDIVSANQQDGTTKVFDGKTLTSKGELNMTLDCPNTEDVAWWDSRKIVWLGNDVKGRLVAVLNSTGKSDSSPVVYLCWKDGWDQAPTYIRRAGGAFCNYMTVSGDLYSGPSMLISKGGGETGTHNILRLNDGVPPTEGYYQQIATNESGIDASWSQQVSACTGDENGRWFMHDAVANATKVFTWDNWAGGSVTALGTKTEITGNINGGWGNFTRGGIKSFVYDDIPMAVVLSTGWPCTYVSVIDADGTFYLSSDQENATLAYDQGEYDPNQGYNPIPAYYYNEEEQCGYIYVLCPSYAIHSWKISEEWVEEQ